MICRLVQRKIDKLGNYSNFKEPTFYFARLKNQPIILQV